MSEILYAGSTSYNTPHFFIELMKGLNDPMIKSEEVKKIIDNLTVIHSNKQKEEKKKDGKKKPSKNQKPQIKSMGAKGVDNSRNNNQQMIGDLVGGDDDYGDEYGEYGEETNANSKRIADD